MKLKLTGQLNIEYSITPG